MVRENILEFERKHSKNLTELNEWLERVKKFDENQPKTTATVSEEDGDEAWRRVSFLENSKLYKDTGKLWDSDPLYKKINTTALEDMAHLKTLAQYLTQQELQERLIYENYMLLETEIIIDRYLIHIEDKKSRDRIAKLRRELEEEEAKLKIPTIEDKVEEILSHMNKR